MTVTANTEVVKQCLSHPQTKRWSPLYTPPSLFGRHICEGLAWLSTTVPATTEEVIEASTGFSLAEMSFLFVVRERVCVWRGWRGKRSEELHHYYFLNVKRSFNSIFRSYILVLRLTATENFELTGSCKQVILLEWLGTLSIIILQCLLCFPAFPIGCPHS
jgi:hypothetical protein